jgi:dUTP pyrophosphatase
MQLNIQLLRNGQIPTYATAHSAGMDLYAAIDKDIVLKPKHYQLIPCGFAMALPIGYEAQIRPRSGLALKHGVTVLNAPGTIDADYRGEVGAILINMGDNEFTIVPQMRVAQMVITSYQNIVCQSVAMLETTERGVGGFGSTGV